MCLLSRFSAWLISAAMSPCLISALVLISPAVICLSMIFSLFINNGAPPALGINSCNDVNYSKAPEYRNAAGCPALTSLPSDPSLVHVTMTLDSEYLRGSMAAVHSVLRHASCPDQVFFHFISTPVSPQELTRLLRTVYPSLSFKLYDFQEETVTHLISPSIRPALQDPLNYARNYLGDMLDSCVKRVIYLDSDLVLVDDIAKLWGVSLSEGRVIGAPEYCHANFTRYFTDRFWSDRNLNGVFESRSRSPCYFNTGVMVMDLERWREGQFREKIEYWMRVQREKRIYELGSLPPFLLVFGGNVEPIDHRWNQHGLGGDSVTGSCRELHDGPVSLLHWSGKGKPWVRLDEGRPCPLDHLWEPYDLYNGTGKVRKEHQLALYRRKF